MSEKETAANQADRAPEHTYTGQVVSALTFIMIVFFLGLWIAFFLPLEDQLFGRILPGNVFNNLTCIVFSTDM